MLGRRIEEVIVHQGEKRMLEHLDSISAGIPYTPPRTCHLLYHLVSTFTRPNVIEVACGYGKATLYLAAAARQRAGFMTGVDLAEPSWGGRSAVDLLRDANLLNICHITFGCDARWYLLDLLHQRPGQWIDLAYLDATHTVEVDSFVALAAWTHLRPGGILAFDDLDWVPAVHAPDNRGVTASTVSHVRRIFDYIGSLADVDDKAEWGREELNWTWGFIRKRHVSAAAMPLRELLGMLDDRFTGVS